MSAAGAFMFTHEQAETTHYYRSAFPEGTRT